MLQEHFWIYIQELILAVLGDAGDQTLVSHVQGRCLTHCTITQALFRHLLCCSPRDRTPGWFQQNKTVHLGIKFCLKKHYIHGFWTSLKSNKIPSGVYKIQ